MRQATLAVG